MEDKVLLILRNILECNEISVNSSKTTISNWDSMAVINMIAEFEESFGISIEPEEIKYLDDVKGILFLLNNKTKIAGH